MSANREMYDSGIEDIDKAARPRLIEQIKGMIETYGVKPEEYVGASAPFRNAFRANLDGIPVVFSEYYGKDNPPVLIDGVIYAFDAQTLEGWIENAKVI